MKHKIFTHFSQKNSKNAKKVDKFLYFRTKKEQNLQKSTQKYGNFSDTSQFFDKMDF